MTFCPCGSSILYQQCCEKFITGEALPPTPEALMRSRYTAFTLHHLDYIQATMKGKALKRFNVEQAEARGNAVQWEGLCVIRQKMTSAFHGYVTFEARYIQEGAAKSHYEKSEFKKINNKWYYINGVFLKPQLEK